MKHQLKSAALLGVATIYMTSSAAFAVTSTPATSTPTATTTTTTLEQRLTARKTALKTKLDVATTTRITTKCKAAQALITASKTKTHPNIGKRLDTYNDISTKLKNLSIRLNKQGVDITEITAVQTALDTKAAKYKTDFDAYAQTIDDLTSIDCVADPTGFKATLESLRTERVAVGKDAADVRALQPELAKAISDAKLALANKSTKTTGGSN